MSTETEEFIKNNPDKYKVYKKGDSTKEGRHLKKITGFKKHLNNRKHDAKYGENSVSIRTATHNRTA